MILFVNAINISKKGSGFYITNYWIDTLIKSKFEVKLFNLSPPVSKSKILNALWYFPGTVFRIFKFPGFEVFFKVSLIDGVRFIFNLIKNKVDSVVFSHHASIYLMFIVPRNVRKIYICHDSLYKRAMSFGFPRRICKVLFSFEIKMYNYFDTILFVSFDELALYRRFVTKRSGLLRCLDDKEYSQNTRDVSVEEIALISDWRRSENIEGFVEFFRGQKGTHRKSVSLNVYGMGSEKIPREFDKYFNISYKGRYKNLNSIREGIFLVPIYKGAGVKVKVIEALMSGKFVVGTRQSVVGLPSDLYRYNVKIIDSPEELIRIERNDKALQREEWIELYRTYFRPISEFF